MADLFQYVFWRGDLSFSAVPPCDVDALIFARLSYIPFDGVVAPGFGGGVPLGEAARAVLAGDALEKRQGLVREDRRLLEALCEAPRYADLELCGFEQVFDAERQEQFAALTVRLPMGPCVAFRGTDGTLVGWKEDFNMAFSEAVPAQLRAVEYFQRAAMLPGGIRLCGHSKGGNLAVYAAAFCGEKLQPRIVSVRNFDGPGFQESVTRQEGFRAVIGRTRTYLPKASVVGMLLEHEEEFTVVDSQGSGLSQHNTYLWEIRRGGFCELHKLNGSSQLLDRALKDWLAGMTPEQREKVINGLYAVLESTEASTIRDVRDHGKMAALRAILDLDEETRRLTMSAIRIFYRSLKNALPDSPLREMAERLSFLRGEKKQGG